MTIKQNPKQAARSPNSSRLVLLPSSSPTTMAAKLQTRLVDQPPSASSSEDEEESDPEEVTQESEEESEEEEQQPPKRAPSPPPPPSQKTSVQKPPSSSGSESESNEDESDSSQQTQPSPSASSFTIKHNLPSAAPPPSKPTAKRPPETPVKESAKKKPKSGENGNVEEKKTPGSSFVKVWGDEDEIAVLKGMADYKEQKGLDPNADMSGLYEFVKGNLRPGLSKSQMYEKIRRFKKKFFNAIERGDTEFSKPHDCKIFELSKKVWGIDSVSNGDNVKTPNVKAKSKKIVEPKGSKVNSGVIKEEKEKQVILKEKEDTGQEDFKSKYPRLLESFNKENMPKLSEEAIGIIKENVSVIGSSKAEELEEKWTKLLKEEAALYLKMTDLTREQVQLIMDMK